MHEFLWVSYVTQLLHLGQSVDSFEIYKVSFKAGFRTVPFFLFDTANLISSLQTFSYYL